MTGVCENCGYRDTEVIPVRRVYVTPETWDTPASEEVVETPERWCLSCVSQYPHQPLEEAEGST